MKTFYALLIFIFLFVLAWDNLQKPENELSVKTVRAAITVYQAVGRPILKGRVKCRFEPSCSDYAKAVYNKYGLIKGTRLTVVRISKCKAGVPMHTADLP